MFDATGTQRYFIIDSGASISTVRERSVNVNDFRYLDTRHTLNIVGISGTLQALGLLPLSYHFENVDVSFIHKFYVLPASCDLQADGIIGSDFLKAFDAVLNYKDASLTLLVSGNYITIPLHTKPKVSNVIIPPRCEQLVHVPTAETTDLVIQSQVLSDGVFVARILVRPVAGYFSCFVVNTTDLPFTFSPSCLHYEYLSDFDVCHLSSAQQCDSRKELLLSELKLSHLQPFERETITDLCSEFNDIFHLEGDKLTCTNVCQQRIYLKPGATPIYTKQYRIPHSQKSEIKRQVTEMLENDLIEPSLSDWNSPLLLIPKKLDSSGKQKYRVVIDYRAINKNALRPDRFPLPQITDILDRLGQCVYFSCLDLSQGFYQLEIDPRDREITAFSTDEGHYQLKRLPMGMSISPSAFSRVMSIALSGLTQERCFVYLDDLVVFGKSL